MAVPLLWAWTLLILYASLFPFDGWLLPQGLPLRRMLNLPWPTWRDRFDEIANLLGYLPFGALACGAAMRRGFSWQRAVVLGLVAAVVLSYGVELTQSFLPTRVPSLKDTAFNVLGSMIGAAASVVLLRGGLVEPWLRVRDRWFSHRSSAAMAMLLLWPGALLFPAPVPLGLGHVWNELAQLLLDVVHGTPWVAPIETWLAGLQQPAGLLHANHELGIVALGLLGPCLLSFALAPGRRRRLTLAVGALVLALLVTTLSTTLSFGPEHALAWLTPNVVKGLVAGLVAAMICAALPMRAAAVLAVVVLLGLIVAVSMAPPDPYYAASLSTWEQGRFVRFHGVTQWLAWLWPFAALAWLMPRAFGARV